MPPREEVTSISKIHKFDAYRGDPFFSRSLRKKSRVFQAMHSAVVRAQKNSPDFPTVAYKLPFELHGESHHSSTGNDDAQLNPPEKVL
jgi:hypothetical protein